MAHMEVSIVMGIAQNDPFTMTMTMEPSMTMGIALYKWRFPYISHGDSPNGLQYIGLSLINHPFGGSPMTMETHI